jgi:hypothetical protein
MDFEDIRSVRSHFTFLSIVKKTSDVAKSTVMKYWSRMIESDTDPYVQKNCGASQHPLKFLSSFSHKKLELNSNLFDANLPHHSNEKN